MKRRKIMLPVVLLMALATITAACGSKAGSSPTATAIALNEAMKRSDVAGMKSLMTKHFLDMTDRAAKAQNKSIDELLMQDDEDPAPATLDTRNEKIDGDKATLEVNTNGKGKWVTFNFVKEDGLWKLDH